MVSAFTRGLDDMLRKTDWWEKSIKPATDFMTKVFHDSTPQIKLFSQAIFDKFHQLGSKGGDLFNTTLTKLLGWMTDMIKSLDQAKIDAFGVWLDNLPTKIGNFLVEGNKLANDTIPKLVTGLEAIAWAIQKITDIADFWITLKNGGGFSGGSQTELDRKDGMVPYVAPSTLPSSINPNQSAMDVVMGRNSSATPEKSSLEVNINTITGQTTTATKGTGIKKPVVNTGNNSNRAQPISGASLFGAY